MNVMIEQRGVRSIEVVRHLVVEVPDGPDPTPEQIERIMYSLDERYGPFRFSPVKKTQELTIGSTQVIRRTSRPADVPLLHERTI